MGLVFTGSSRSGAAPPAAGSAAGSNATQRNKHQHNGTGFNVLILRCNYRNAKTLINQRSFVTFALVAPWLRRSCRRSPAPAQLRQLVQDPGNRARRIKHYINNVRQQRRFCYALMRAKLSALRAYQTSGRVDLRGRYKRSCYHTGAAMD